MSKPTSPDYEYVYEYEYEENSTIPVYYDVDKEIQLVLLISSLADWLYTAKFVAAIAGFFLNIPHFLVLIHKDMRTSSINTIMCAVAFADILITFNFIYQYLFDLYSNGICNSPFSYHFVLISLFSEICVNIFLRVSPWLGLMTAVIRLLVISFPFNDQIGRLSDKPTGYRVIVILILISSLISAGNYGRMTIVKDGRWKPPKSCGYPPNYSELQYTMVIGRKLFFTTSTTDRIHFIVKGACNVIPAICYPILALFLVFKFAKIEKNRDLLAGERKKREKQNTTKLVILMTITFSLSQLPFGIDYWLQLYYANNSVISLILEYQTVFSTVLLTISATFHVCVFVLMSSQYREVARKVFGCLRWDNQVNVVMVASSNAESEQSRHI